MGRASRRGGGVGTATPSQRVSFAAAGIGNLTRAQSEFVDRGLNNFFQRYPETSPLRQHWDKEERKDFVNGMVAEVSIGIQQEILESKLESAPLGGGAPNREPLSQPPLGQDLASANQDLVEQAQIINPNFDKDNFARIADDPRLRYDAYEQAVQSGSASNMNYTDYLRSILSGVDLIFVGRSDEEVVNRIFEPSSVV